VFDGFGENLGLYAGREDEATLDSGYLRSLYVYLESVGLTLQLNAVTGELRTRRVTFYFEDVECEGTAFVEEAAALLRPNFADNSAYFASGGLPETITPLATSFLPGSAPCEALGGPEERRMVAAEPVDPQDLGVSFPIAVPLVVAPLPPP
jgi:hypothetical protein